MPTLARRVEPPRMHICHVAALFSGPLEAYVVQPTAVSRSGLGISAPHIFSSA
jgi:hypothetical protein